MFTVHAVLAGAYKGKGKSLKDTLTHASVDQLNALCGKVAEGNLCDLEEEGPPSCATCARRAAKLGARP